MTTMTTTTTCELQICKDDCDHISPGPVTHFLFLLIPPGHLAFCDLHKELCRHCPYNDVRVPTQVSED